MSQRTKKWLALFRSPIGKKLLTGITGLGLTVFVFVHMVGNLSYLSSDPNAYNLYADFLTGLGPIFYVIELGLLAFFVIHIIIGIKIWLGKRKAREVGYNKYKSMGGPSKQSLSSRSMIVTGLILMVFLIFHLISFKYGPEYEIDVAGTEIRDLKRLLDERFNEPLYAFGYPAVMILLAFHLRHGIWSAFQSIGAMKPKLTPLVYTIGVILAVLIAVGFLFIPLYIFFFVDPPSVVGMAP